MTPQQLRSSILQLAIQGRLVEQRPEEGTGAELLREISTQRRRDAEAAKKESRATSAKSAKESRLASNVSRPVEDAPFEIPESWVWVRLGDIADVQLGKMLDKGKNKGTPHPYLANLSVRWGTFDLSELRMMPFTEDECRKFALLPGDVLMCEGGVPGRCAVWREENSPIKYQKAVHRIRSKFLFPDYIQLFFETICDTAEFAELFTGTTIKHLPREKLIAIPIPLPPLAEQKRIVAKIEELLPLIDRYEKAWSKLEDFNKRFPVDMQKSLLQLAIQGKLVEQRPEEGTAAELLEKIFAVKNAKDAKKGSRATSAKSAKESRLASNVSRPVEDAPFDIPESWEWVRLGHIMINRDAERIPLSVDERSKLAKKYDYYGASGVIDKVDDFIFDKPLLLIGEDGANLLTRNTPIAFIARGQYWVNNHAHVLDCNSDLLHMEYVMWFINAINLAPYVTGTAQPKMNQQKMNSIPVALPPLAEQKRIVAKLEEILPLCKRLKKSLEDTP